MKTWIGLAILVLTLGCISTNVQRLDQTMRPARSPESVQVLLEEPQRPYTVIALIESTTETVFDSFDDLREAMVTEAAALGGEALILGPEATDSEFIMTGTALIQSDHRTLICEVIVFERKE